MLKPSDELHLLFSRAKVEGRIVICFCTWAKLIISCQGGSRSSRLKEKRWAVRSWD